MARPLLFAAWTLGASLVLAEISLQVAAWVIPTAPEPGQVAPNPRALRVLALGDSWVAGAEAPEGKGFVDGLRDGLSAKLGAERVQVVNRGRTGANSAHVALTALDEGPVIEPQLYMVLVGQNNASNFARVAEVEERVGHGDDRGVRFERVFHRLRTVKLAHILWANLAGSSRYDRKPLPELPSAATDHEGRPAATDSRLIQGTGLLWYRGEALTLPVAAQDKREALAWTLLELIRQRDALLWDRTAEALAEACGWTPYYGALPAPRADGTTPVRTIELQPWVKDHTESLARYALLRWARERGDWRSVRMHGTALLGTTRDFFADLGGAEAALLGGDWRRARALLVSAHRRGPGAADVVDLASRFPLAARDTAVDEAAEAEPAGRWTPLQHHRRAVGAQQWEDAKGYLEQWVAATPFDEASRADLAILQAISGDIAAARATMGQSTPPPDDLSGPIRSGEWLRYALVDIGESGDRARVELATKAALGMLFARQGGGAASADAPVLRGRELPTELLTLIVQLRGEHGFCDDLPVLADRAYIARGDVALYGRLLQPCLAPEEVERRLDILRPAWAPHGEADGFRALVRAGHQPFQLLFRDLDLVRTTAERYGGRLVVLSYPNPSEDHGAIRDVLAEYTSSRSVEFIDLHKHFAERYDAEAWAALLGPNGHCNEQGYAVMAEHLFQQFEQRGLTALAPGAP